MKIIGTAGSSYLVEVSEDELAAVAGFGSVFSDGWQQIKTRDMGIGAREGLPIGTVIKPSVSYQYLAQMRQASKRLAESADILVGLAHLVRLADPTLIIPEDPQGLQIPEKT